MQRSNSEPAPWAYPVGSAESRREMRRLIEERERPTIRVNIIHIGGLQSGETLPPPQRIKWNGGVTEIVHVG